MLLVTLPSLIMLIYAKSVSPSTFWYTHFRKMATNIISMMVLLIAWKIIHTIPSTLPKSNPHKSNNCLRWKSSQVLFPLFSIIFDTKSNFFEVEIMSSVPRDMTWAELTVFDLIYSPLFINMGMARRFRYHIFQFFVVVSLMQNLKLLPSSLMLEIRLHAK